MGQRASRPSPTAADATTSWSDAFATPCGWIAWRGEGPWVTAISVGNRSREEAYAQLQAAEGRAPTAVEKSPDLQDRLIRYAQGEFVTFADLTYRFEGLTEFQQAVVAAVRDIPYGEMRTYGEVAAEVGHPGAARGVGTVMSRNSLPLLIPCHRVVGSNGGLGGYSAAEGLPFKRRLLDMEQAAAVVGADRAS